MSVITGLFIYTSSLAYASRNKIRRGIICVYPVISGLVHTTGTSHSDMQLVYMWLVQYTMILSFHDGTLSFVMLML